MIKTIKGWFNGYSKVDYVTYEIVDRNHLQTNHRTAISSSMRLDKSGNLIIETSSGQIELIMASGEWLSCSLP